MGFHTLEGAYGNPFALARTGLQPIIFWRTLTSSANAIADGASACTIVMHRKIGQEIRWLCSTGRSMVLQVPTSNGPCDAYWDKNGIGERWPLGATTL
jgi:hypothetical protein